eukprot:gnl/TRDRNA2_/TRDRNA2_155696_c1_seq2.p1 gnl/TRDRNA2_/TRDRNA2_155696_c1~~gnl/TRDRNA2_/TRDRNA2_155696_c1_seq2.p1  ORF type:complete len:362 (+),score=89.92 gnl/TRDRNA2_/TRDRNA2_155696_c1_seq2:112-1197(+)
MGSGGGDDDGALWGSNELVTADEIAVAKEALKQYPHILCTPMMQLNPEDASALAPGARAVSLKLESMQTTGSFKIRGMQYKLHCSDAAHLRESGIVTMSAGNAGKAVSYLAKSMQINAKVFMPETAPDDRKAMMESFGSTVEKVPGPELLSRVAASIRDEKRVFVHPFDDTDIIRGHASCGLEILEDVPDVDVIVVCCGGGGILAGIAAAAKLGPVASDGDSKRTAAGRPRVIGVEPEGANSMYLSWNKGEAVWCPDGGKTHTIAHGLAPPFAGRACFNHVKHFADDVVLVTDGELRAATKLLFELGVVAEVSGAAAVAAVMAGKVADIAGKQVCCVVTGRNIEPVEYGHAMDLQRPMDAH